MAVFGLHDIDPIFEGLSQLSQETILSLATGQAGSFIPAIQASAEVAVAEGDVQPHDIPKDQEQLSEEDFNYVLSQAHPAILKSVFVMGFTQGFCLRHRLQWLDTELYSAMPNLDDVDAGEDGEVESSEEEVRTDDESGTGNEQSDSK